MTSTGIVVVAADSVSTSLDLPADSGAHFFTTNGDVFIAVQTYGGNQTYDWGLGLPPAETLTSAAILSWGPGYGVTASGDNANPVWVTAVSNTTLYVDYDSDPETGAFTDPMGNKYDVSANVTALQAVRLYDNSDDDQTRLKVYTVDGTFFVSAWGQDPSEAGTGSPYLDMGNVILPFPSIVANKFSTLFVDSNVNGLTDPGDVLEFTVEVANVGFATANHVMFFDDGGDTNVLHYQTNSTAINGIPLLDDLLPRITPFPFDEGGYDLGTIPVSGVTTVRYEMAIADPYPTNLTTYLYNAAQAGGSNGSWNTVGFDVVNLPGLGITKETSTTHILDPGDTFTYTVSVVNTGNLVYTGVELKDVLPLGVSWTSGAVTVQYPVTITNHPLDRFDIRSYSGDDGSVAWLNDWQEVGESDGALAGWARVVYDTDVSPAAIHALRLGDPSGNTTRYGAWRAADITGYDSATLRFDYRRDNLNFANDLLDVQVSTNGGGSWVTLGQLGGDFDDSSYAETNYNLNSYINTNTFIRFHTSGTLDDNEFLLFDNVRIDLTTSNNLISNAEPPELFQNISLPPGTSIVATINVQVENPPLATQLVNRAQVRADQHEGWKYSNYVTNSIKATASLEIDKETSTTNLLSGGDSITYTITLQNTGDVVQTSVQLQDLLPDGVSYVENSAKIWRDFAHTNTVADQFNLARFDNQDGNVDWETDWIEVTESNGPSGGDILIDIDTDVSPAHNYALEMGKEMEVYRVVDLSGYTNANFSFEYRRWTVEAGDDTYVHVSDDGGDSWTLLDTFAGGTTDADYVQTNYNITAYISTNTAILFESSFSWEVSADAVWIDNVVITYSTDNATNRISAPPDMLSGYTLPPGESVEITMDVLVDNPPLFTQLVNVAKTSSDQHPSWLTDQVTNAVDGVEGFDVFKSSNISTSWGLHETNLYTISIVNTGLVTLTGVSVSDALPAGVVAVTNPIVIVPGFDSNQVFDAFASLSYGRNDGAESWLDEWQETNDGTTGPSNGNIRVVNGRLRMDQITNESIQRRVNLQDAVSATLTYNWEVIGIEAEENISVLIATNSAGPFTELASYTGAAGSDVGTFDVLAYASDQTTLRFDNTGPNMEANDFAYFDNINVEWVLSRVTTNEGAMPPAMGSGYTIPVGTSMTVQVQAVLDFPLTQTQFVNTVTVNSDAEGPKIASVTNDTELVALGGLVWLDTNTNGIQNGGETFVSNVTVTLYDAATNAVYTTNTDANGIYLFSGWPAGTYFVEFDDSSGFTFSPKDQGGDDDLDSDVNPSTGRIDPVTLAGNTSQTNLDAGVYWASSSLSGWVWLDADSNGVSSAESGKTNVTVNLLDSGGSVIATTNTDASGNYTFQGLEAGDYEIEVIRPAGYVFSAQNTGGDDTIDSDVNPANGRTGTITLPWGTDAEDWDAGLVLPSGGLSITKVSDAGGTNVIAGQTIQYTVTVVNTGTVTQAGVSVYDEIPAGLTYVSNSSTYAFYELSTNTCRDEFSAVAYTNQDGTHNWSGDWVEEDPAGTAGPVGDYVGVDAGRMRLYWLYVGDESAQRSADLGGAASATLSFDWETVSLDADEFLDIQISTNSGGTFVQLDRLGGTGTGSTNYDITSYISTDTTIRFEASPGTTDWDGDDYAHLDNVEISYVFSGLTTNPASNPSTFTSGNTLGTGKTLTVSFDVTVDSPLTTTQFVNTAQTYSDTFGPIEASVTDQVAYAELAIFKSVTDATPIPGQVIEYTLVLTNNGPSDATGIIVEDVLPPDPPMQYNSTSNGAYNVGSSEWIIDSLAVGASTSLYINMTVRLDTEDLLITNVAEITRSDQYDPITNNNSSSVMINGGMIGDFVWHDENTNGVQDAGEPGVAGVGVTLYGVASNVLATTTTDSSGEYRFEGLDAGDYFLGFTPVTGWRVTIQYAGTSDFTDSDVNTNTLQTGIITLSLGEADLSIDMGLVEPSDPTDIGITKTVNDSAPMEGQSILYTLVAVNNGPTAAPTVEITDALPSGLTYVTNTSGGAYSTVSNVWNIGAMTVGSSTSLVIEATVDAFTEGNTIVNTALVTRVGATDTNAANDSSTATLTVQTSSSSPDCGLTYLMADAGGGNGGNDWFATYDSDTSTETAVGTGTGTDNIEAIAFNPMATILYAADANELGTINRTSGVYTTIGSFGTGNGSLGSRAFDDIDGLSVDPLTGILYGSNREATEDLLLQINPSTGAYIPDAFGSGIDYVVINSISNHLDIDDIAIDPYDGQMYGIANSGGAGDRLVKINKLTGVATDVGLLGVDDHEGLSFSNDGQLFGTTGNTGGDSLYDVNKSTGVAGNQRALGVGSDYEGSENLLCPPNRIEGTVFFDANEDAFLDGGDSGAGSVTVNLYRDVNGDGILDGGDILLTTQQTDSSGEYAFDIASVGAFVLNVDTNTLPSNSTLTTDNIETADFGTSTGLTEGGNDFGYTRAADLAITKTVSPTGNVTNNQVLSYTITVSNLSSVTQTDIVITDPVPDGTTYVTGTATVDGYRVTSETVREEFNAIAFTNQDGTANWANDWQEIGESNGADGNAVRVQTLLGSDYALRIYNSARGLWREADLSGYDSATLTFDYRIVGFDDGNEGSYLSISTNGGTSWVQLHEWTANVGTTTAATFDLTSYISANTAIAFTNRTANEGSEGHQLDNIQIEYSKPAASTTNAHDPGNLVIAGDGFLLESGAVMTVTFDVTVDTNPGVDSVLNTASVTSDQQLSPLTASTTNPILGEITGHLYIDTNGNGTQDGGEPDLENVDVLVTDALGGTQTVTTDSNGDYTATVPAGDTITNIDETDPDYPAGYLQTEGTDPTTTSAVAGASTFTENDGFHQGGVIGDLVWFDENGNGIQEAGETNRIENLTVLLLDTNDLQVASAITDSNGQYRFENILPGDYRIRFDLTIVSTNVGVVVANAGGDDTLDSDVTSGNTGGVADTDIFTLTGGQTNLTIDLGLARKGSTRAEVAEVWGEWVDGVASVVWETSSEWNTAGFFVYRVEDETRLNAKLLPADFFTPGGSVYRIEDFQALENQSETYRLEEREITGGTIDLGVHSITFSRPWKTKAPMLAEPMDTPIALADEAPQEPSDVLKVLVQTDGMVGVSLQTIADGMGRTLADVQSLVSSNRLQVAALGEVTPIYFDSERDRILFFGQASANWYTPDAAYLISEGDSLSMPHREADAFSAPSVFPTTLRFEEDVYPFDNVLTRLDDYHYWKYILSDHATFGQLNFPLDLSGHVRGDVELTVRLRGWSSSAFDPDHLAEFFFNGTNRPIGSVTFDDASVAEARLVVPEEFVQDGTNTLTVKGILQPDQSYSYFVVNWIDATFDRRLVPQSDAAAFRANESYQISAQEFSEPAAMALSDQQSPVWIEMGVGEESSKGWNVESSDSLFDVEEVADLPMVGTLAAASEGWFMVSSNQVDYLIISSRALASAAQELADYRSSQGLKTGVAIFEDVCDLIAHGYRTPEAIPALLRYAQDHWSKSPWMVVLAGSGSYDYLGTFNEVNHLPPLLLETEEGLFAADGLLTDLNGDGLSDVAIGRLPALTSTELTAMIDKIKTYERQFGSAWQNELVLAADTSDIAGDFPAVNAAFEALAEPDYPVENIDLNTTETTNARARLLTRFETGAGIIHYTGHGGANNLSSKELLTSSDVHSMTNANTPPVVIALSCLIGRYESPGSAGLGETLMRKSDGGAVAVWSPSGLSMNTAASALGDAFYQNLLVDGDGTLGLAVLQAHRDLAITPAARDTVAVYNLLGDPALRLAGNTQSPQPESTYEQWRWQVFAPQELTNAAVSSQGADPNGNGQNNLIEYAFGGDPVDGVGAIRTLETGAVVEKRGAWAYISWRQRAESGTLSYRISTSTNLTDWTVSPQELEILSMDLVGDGTLEDITARLPFPGRQLFIKLDVLH